MSLVSLLSTSKMYLTNNPLELSQNPCDFVDRMNNFQKWRNTVRWLTSLMAFQCPPVPWVFRSCSWACTFSPWLPSSAFSWPMDFLYSCVRKTYICIGKGSTLFLSKFLFFEFTGLHILYTFPLPGRPSHPQSLLVLNYPKQHGPSL